MKKLFILLAVTMTSLSMSGAPKYVDLGLPSGTKWAEQSEPGFYTYDQALQKFGKKLPTKEQMDELITYCLIQWDFDRNGLEVTGPNGNSMIWYADGWKNCEGELYDKGSYSAIWSSSKFRENYGYDIIFGLSGASVDFYTLCQGICVRLVK